MAPAPPGDDGRVVTTISANGPHESATARRRGTGRDVPLAAPRDVRQLMLLQGAGASMNTTAAALNGGGSRTSNGTRWTAATVAAVICAEAMDSREALVKAPDEAVRLADRLRAIGELGQAITTGQLEVHYQPVVDLVTGELLSVEALVRWRHPVRGLVAPDEFVPLAESCGLITELTEFVVRTAIDQTEEWAREGRPVRCAVNLSASSLCDARWSARLVALLRNRARYVTVEVTEGVLADERAIGVLRELAGYGIDVALDDFGTGYSCLAALRDLPLRTLKIDRSFLAGIDEDERAASVVAIVIQLAVVLGLDVVAEGIETEAVADVLRGYGVRKAQGFLFARPMPAAELAAWLPGGR